MESVIGRLRHRVVSAQQAVRPAHAGGREPDLACRSAHGQGRTRVQPRLRRPDVRLQPVRPLPRSPAPTRRRSSTSSASAAPSPTASTRPTSTYQRQLGNLRLDFPTHEIAFFAQDTWKLRPNLTINYGLRWEGASNPTPEANNEFMLDALQRRDVPDRGTTVDPTQIPDQWNPVRSARRLRVGSWPTTAARSSAATAASTTRARRRSCWAAPMNNFRVPAGDLSLQLPAHGAGEQPQQHRLQAAAADRHRPQ